MGRKIYLSEDKFVNIRKTDLLPSFIFKKVKEHKTSLGDNLAFPSNLEYPFDYVIIKQRYKEVCDAARDIDIFDKSSDELISILSKLLYSCMEMERPIRNSLEKICVNSLNKIFAIPPESINLDCKLVDKLTFDNSLRMYPEEVDYSFEDINDIDLSDKAIGKRRFIDALIQGGAYILASESRLYDDDINMLNQDLIPLYEKIKIINDYLLFTQKEKLTDDNPMQGAYVDTRLGGENMKSSISVQGLIFPLLLQETIRGMLELFSSHGLPQDKEKAIYIVNKADFVLAEPWDMRLGVGIWKKLFDNVQDTNLIPYVFTKVIKLPTKKFNKVIREKLANTKKGNYIFNDFIKKSEYDSSYQQFTNRIKLKNLNKSIIQDSCL